MGLLEKMDMYLLSEAKTQVSPYLKSVMKKQTAFTDDELTKLVKGLTNIVDSKISIAVSSNGKTKYLTVDSKESDDKNSVESKLKSLGYKISNDKVDGGITYIYFE